MGYYEDLYMKNLENPTGKNLVVVAPMYLSKKTMTFIIEKTGSDISKYAYKIYGDDCDEEFKGRKTNRKRIIYTSDNEPIFTVKETNSRKSRKKMYLGKNKKGRFLGIIRAKHCYDNEDRKYSQYNYKVKFHNISVKKNEFVEMNSDEDKRICAIFYGKEKENAPVICKITRNPENNQQVTVQIASGVDYMFILGLAFFFLGRKNYTNTDQKITGRKRIFIDGNRNSYIPEFCSKNIFYFHSDDGKKFIRCWGGPSSSIKSSTDSDHQSVQNCIFKNKQNFPYYVGDDINNEYSFFATYTGNNTYVRQYTSEEGLINKDSFYLYYEGKDVYSRYTGANDDDDSSSCDDGYKSSSSFEDDDNIDKMCNLLNNTEIKE